MIEQAINLLKLLSDKQVHSGVELGEKLGVSRAAVWKLIQKTQQQLGIEIRSIGGAGYVLAHPVILLNTEEIRRYLEELGASHAVANINVLGTTTSTNDLALMESAKGAPNLSVWLAEHQNAGRGRRGKAWLSPMLGNIYCTLLWRFTGGSQVLEGLSLAVGVAIAEGLSDLGVHKIQLKWPNDIWIDQQKLGGVLIEISGDPYGDCAVVIGFGINLQLSAQMTETIDQPATALVYHSQIEDRNKIIAVLIRSITNALQEHKQYGFKRFESRWRAFDALMGRSIRVLGVGNEQEGKCLGVNDRGALLLESAKGIEEIYSGEVSVRVG